MAKRNHTELITGLFVLAALGAGLGVLLWLGAIELGRRGPKAVFVAGMGEGNMGLEVGSAVKINDAVIGRLEEIDFRPDEAKTYYVASLHRDDLRVCADARASAIAEFIGGAAIVLESLGSEAAGGADRDNPAPLAASNALLKGLGYGAEQKAQFQQALADVRDSAQSLSKVLGVLGSEARTADIGAIVSNVRSASDNLAQTSAKLDKIASSAQTELNKDLPESLLAGVKRTVGHVEIGSENVVTISKSLRRQTDSAQPDSFMAKALRSADHVENVTKDAAGMIATIRPDVEETTARVREAAQKDLAELLVKFRKTSTNLVEVSEDLRAVSGTTREIIVLNRDRLDDTLANIKGMSSNLEAAAKEIRRNPWRLLHRPDEKELQRANVYDAARAFVEGARSLDDAMTRLKALRDDRPEGVPADDPELAKIREHLKNSFERFRTVEDALWKELSQ